MKTKLYIMLLVLSLSVVAGYDVTALATPLKAYSAFDNPVECGGYYGYHYSVNVGVGEDFIDFYLFTCPFETEAEFLESFLESGQPGNPSTLPPYDFYQPEDWTYQLVFNGPISDPVFPWRNDYVHWSGPLLKGPTGEDPNVLYISYVFGFCNINRPRDGAYRLTDYVPPPKDPIYVPAPELATIAVLTFGGLVIFDHKMR